MSTITLLLVIAAAVYLYQRRGDLRMGSSVKARTDYQSPVRWMNYHDTVSIRDHAREKRWHRPFSTDDDLIRERSNMSQFVLWYYTGHYAFQNEGDKNTTTEWVSVIDGNPHIGTDTAAMPTFIQFPVFDPSKRRHRLALLTITSQQVQRLRSGPPRKEPFDLVEHSTGRGVRQTLDAGSFGGQWPAPIPERLIVDSGGSSHPSTPEGWG